MDACGLWGKREAESRDSGDMSEAFVAIIIFCSKLSVCLLFTFYISLSLLCIL